LRSIAAELLGYLNKTCTAGTGGKTYGPTTGELAVDIMSTPAAEASHIKIERAPQQPGRLARPYILHADAVRFSVIALANGSVRGT